MKKEYFISCVASPEGSYMETAIVVRNKKDYTTRYYILVGDHRAEYAKCRTFTECKKYYLRNKKIRSEFADLLY